MTHDQYATARDVMRGVPVGLSTGDIHKLLTALAAARQLRTHGTVEVCSKCRGGEFGSIAMRHCITEACPLLRADREE